METVNIESSNMHRGHEAHCAAQRLTKKSLVPYRMLSHYIKEHLACVLDNVSILINKHQNRGGFLQYDGKEINRIHLSKLEEE